MVISVLCHLCKGLKQGQLVFIFGNGEGQFSGWIYLTEKNICQGRARLPGPGQMDEVNTRFDTVQTERWAPLFKH